MSEIVSMTEAVSITGLPEDQIDWLLKGSRPALEPMTLRHVFGAKLVADLIAAINAEAAMRIAGTAASRAEVGGGRVMLVGWAGDGNARCCWRPETAPFEPGICTPFLSIPADLALGQITDRLMAHRAAASQPN